MAKGKIIEVEVEPEPKEQPANPEDAGSEEGGLFDFSVMGRIAVLMALCVFLTLIGFLFATIASL